MLYQSCSQQEVKLGSIFVEKQIISLEQLEIALAEHQKNNKKLGEFLVQKQWITPEQLETALQEQNLFRRLIASVEEALGIQRPPKNGLFTQESFREIPKIGEILVEKNYITSSQLKKALTQQQHTNQKLGEVLIAEGLISERELKTALADEKILKFLATFLIINLGAIATSTSPTLAGEKKSTQATIRFSAYIPEKVLVEINPQVFATSNPALYRGNLLKISDNAQSDQNITNVKYDEKEALYTITPR